MSKKPFRAGKARNALVRRFLKSERTMFDIAFGIAIDKTLEAARARERMAFVERRATLYAHLALLSSGALAIALHAAILWFCL